jgi:hypothetical protein
VAPVTPTPSLGITVLGDYVASEGPEAVIDRVAGLAGADAVATNPTVTEPAPEGTGSFQPPDDGGSSPRRFDRPLWGRTALWVRAEPSWRPRAEMYGPSPYPPRRAGELTDARGPLIARFIAGAKERGLQVYLQLGAAQPPGLRLSDTPRLPDGGVPEGRMAAVASLASEAVRAYNRALARDLLLAYPQIDGFRLDWPEYPCYTIPEAFQDFGAAAQAWGRARGFAWDELRAAADALWRRLHGGLTAGDCERLAAGEPPARAADAPALAEALRLKAALSVDLLADWRDAIDRCGRPDARILAHAFPPPLSRLTGFDFAGAARFCASVSPKLYTMHWPQIVRFWATRLLAHNEGLGEERVVRALDMAFGFGIGGSRLEDFSYPEPGQPHRAGAASQRVKLREALALVDRRARVTALVHGYGPLRDFSARFRLAWESGVDGVWVNRYGYLSDAKLAEMGRIRREGHPSRNAQLKRATGRHERRTD